MKKIIPLSLILFFFSFYSIISAKNLNKTDSSWHKTNLEEFFDVFKKSYEKSYLSNDSFKSEINKTWKPYVLSLSILRDFLYLHPEESDKFTQLLLDHYELMFKFKNSRLKNTKFNELLYEKRHRRHEFLEQIAEMGNVRGYFLPLLVPYLYIDSYVKYEIKVISKMGGGCDS